MTEEKIYFLADTDEEVQLGDVIKVNFTKDLGDGRSIEHEASFKLTEETLGLALELGIIEEGDSKDLLDIQDEETPEELLSNILDYQKELDERVTALEDLLTKEIKETNKALKEVLTLVREKKGSNPTSSKKK